MAQPPFTLTDLATRWAAKHHPGAMLERQMRLVTHDLSLLTDVTDPRRLTPSHLGALLDDLLACYPRHLAHMMFCLAEDLLQFGVRESLLTTNPARDLTISMSLAAPPQRSPFTPEELARIFGHPLFTAHAIPSAGGAGGIAAYWLPLILLCAGARAKEAAALRTDHLRYSADVPPIPYWRFEGGTKTAPLRPRPVHPILCRLGLLDYSESLPPGADLFPLLRPDREGLRARRFCAYFHHFLRTVGILDRSKTTHSFRHNFALACRQARLPPDVSEALRGHGARRTVAHDDGELPLATLQREIHRLTFPGFPI